MNRDFPRQRRRDDAFALSEVGQPCLALRQSVAVFLGLLMKEVKYPRRSMHSQMLFEIKARDCVQHSRGLVWIGRLITDTNPVSQLDRTHVEILFQSKNRARNVFVGYSPRTIVTGTQDLASDRNPEGVAYFLLKITRDNHFRKQVL